MCRCCWIQLPQVETSFATTIIHNKLSSRCKIAELTSPTVIIIWLPSASNIITGTVAAQNSARNCLHMPHGEQNDDADDVVVVVVVELLFLLAPGRSDATATARIPPGRTPAATAVPSATRSAHMPTGKAAFSTFAPV